MTFQKQFIKRKMFLFDGFLFEGFTHIDTLKQKNNSKLAEF
jgi:hypothetical protein